MPIPCTLHRHWISHLFVFTSSLYCYVPSLDPTDTSPICQGVQIPPHFCRGYPHLTRTPVNSYFKCTYPSLLLPVLPISMHLTLLLFRIITVYTTIGPAYSDVPILPTVITALTTVLPQHRASSWFAHSFHPISDKCQLGSDRVSKFVPPVIAVACRALCSVCQSPPLASSPAAYTLLQGWP